MKQVLNIGLIGHKFMGKAHSHAYRDLEMFFEIDHHLVCHTLCGMEDDLEEAAERYGFLHSTRDWKSVVENPEIDVIDICTPDKFHKEIAIEAAKHGKHVICEKPLCLNYQEAREMYSAVKANGVHHLCNFTYRGLPAIKLARQLIESGKIGEIYHFRGFYFQDFSLSPDFPFVWRMDKELAGAGIIGDKGAHVVDLARYLAGEIQEVCCQSAVFVKERKAAESGEKKTVTTSDAAVFLACFENGALGNFEVSNMSAGRKNALLFEITGSKGAIRFDLERLNELEVYFDEEEEGIKGFRKIHVTESCHNLVSHWWPSGHNLGWEHTFIHQIYGLVHAIETGTENESNFYDGMACQQVLDAAALSDQKHSWIAVNEIGGV